jgi:Uncharacterized protein involved in cytokinesis, contains TGc (transglutaminase/protease-like) domain
MKKTAKALLLLTLLILATTCLSACTIISGIFPSLIEGAVEKIEFSADTMIVELRDKKALPVTITPEDSASSVTYSTADAKIATVSSDGKVTGVGVGKTTVTASAGEGIVSDTIEVSVVYATVRTLEISVIGDLSQEYDADSAVETLVFSANANGLDNADPNIEYTWTVKNKEFDTVLETENGKSFSFTMPNTSGATYVVTLTSGEVTASVECGLYIPMQDVVLAYSPTDAAAVLGDELTLALTWNGSSNQNPDIIWYKKEGSGTDYKLSGENKSMLSITPDKRVQYSVYAMVDGVKSNVLTFTPQYNVIKSVTVTPKADKFKTDGEAAFLLEYDLSYIDPNSTVTLEIYANGKDAARTDLFSDNALAFDITEVMYVYTTIGEKSFAVKMNGVWAEATVSIEETLYAALRISPTYEGSLLQTAGSYSQVKFTSNVYPENAPQAVEWYINGTQKATSATFNFTPTAEGEYHVIAKTGNIESAYLTIVCSSSTSVFADYVADFHDYGGYRQNKYITSQREMNNIIHYAVERELTTLSIYVDYESMAKLKEKISLATSTYAESGVRPVISYPDKYGGKATIDFNYTNASAINPDRKTSGANAVAQDTTVPPHYANGGMRTLYIEDTTLPTMDVYSTNMLYKAVQWGYRPAVKGSNATTINAVYSAAKTVMKKIVTDDMTDTQKVHAIYDWICYNVAYDYDLANAEEMTLVESMNYYGYYLEGVFLDSTDRRAVCDGRSKAFVLMCGMEGITSIRISGEAGKDSANRGGHAWNKVLLDADDNGYAEWYFVDTTWGDTVMDNTEFVTHDYLLTTDAANAATHVEKDNGDYPVATGSDYDVYADASFIIDPNEDTFNGYIGVRYEGDLHIDSQEELNKLFIYAKYMGYAKVEFKLVFTTEFDTAVSKAGLNKYSYFTIGDGVYVLLAS